MKERRHVKEVFLVSLQCESVKNRQMEGRTEFTQSAHAVHVSAIACVKWMLMNCADLDDVTESALEPRVTSSVVVPISGKFDMRCRRPRGLPVPTCWSVETHAPLSCLLLFTARCTTVQSAVLRSHVVCLSVCLSVTFVDHDQIG